MPVEIRIAAFGAVLLLVHIIAATQAKNMQYGAKWNIGARDEPLPPPNPIAGRLIRAQANFLETFPIAAGIPVVRTICWGVSIVGLAMVIGPLLFG